MSDFDRFETPYHKRAFPDPNDKEVIRFYELIESSSKPEQPEDDVDGFEIDNIEGE